MIVKTNSRVTSLDLGIIMDLGIIHIYKLKMQLSEQFWLLAICLGTYAKAHIIETTTLPRVTWTTGESILFYQM